MSIEKTPAGTWRVRWREPGRPNPRAKTFRRRVDAERWERKVRADIDTGTYQPRPARSSTVAQTADDWLAASRQLAEATRSTYRRDLDRHILPELGSIRLDQLTADRVDEWMTGRLAVAAPSSVRRERATLHRICTWAISRGRLGLNPVAATEPPADVPKEMRFLSVDEVEAVAAAVSPRYRAMVLVAAWGGLRWSELIGLRPDDVDDTAVHVRSQLLRADNGSGPWHRTAPKTRAGVRRVPLPSSVAQVLHEHLDAYRVDLSPVGPLVFTGAHGRPIGSSTWRTRHWLPALDAAGIAPGVRVHDLRHTAVALAIAAGAHPKAIQVRMGHASITVTLDRYGHLMPDMADQVADGLEQLRTGQAARRHAS